MTKPRWCTEVLAGVALAILGLGASARGQESFGYHPKAPVRIGSILKGSDPFSTRLAVDYDELIRVDGGKGDVPVSLRMEGKQVHSRSELEQSLGIDVQVSARYMTVSGSGSLQLADQARFDEKSLVFVATAHVDFGRWRLKGARFPTLLRTTAGKIEEVPLHLATEAECKEFMEAYGASYVAAVHKAAHFSMVYTFSGLSSERKKDLSAELSASAEGGTWSGDLKAKLKTSETDTENQETLTYQFYSVGFDSRKVAAALAAQENLADLAQLKTTLSSMLQEATAEASAPVTYFSEGLPFHHVEAKPLGSPFNVHQRQALQEMLVEDYEWWSEVEPLCRAYRNLYFVMKKVAPELRDIADLDGSFRRQFELLLEVESRQRSFARQVAESLDGLSTPLPSAAARITELETELVSLRSEAADALGPIPGNDPHRWSIVRWIAAAKAAETGPKPNAGDKAMAEAIRRLVKALGYEEALEADPEHVGREALRRETLQVKDLNDLLPLTSLRRLDTLEVSNGKSIVLTRDLSTLGNLERLESLTLVGSFKGWLDLKLPGSIRKALLYLAPEDLGQKGTDVGDSHMFVLVSLGEKAVVINGFTLTAFQFPTPVLHVKTPHQPPLDYRVLPGEDPLAVKGLGRVSLATRQTHPVSPALDVQIDLQLGGPEFICHLVRTELSSYKEWLSDAADQGGPMQGKTRGMQEKVGAYSEQWSLWRKDLTRLAWLLRQRADAQRWTLLADKIDALTSPAWYEHLTYAVDYAVQLKGNPPDREKVDKALEARYKQLLQGFRDSTALDEAEKALKDACSQAQAQGEQ